MESFSDLLPLPLCTTLNIKKQTQMNELQKKKKRLKGCNSPIRTAGGVLHVGYMSPTNRTSVVFFLSNASRDVDLCMSDAKQAKRSPVVAHVRHVPSQRWCIWPMDTLSRVGDGWSIPWCRWFCGKMRRSRQRVLWRRSSGSFITWKCLKAAANFWILVVVALF